MQMFSSILRRIFELWHLYTNVVFSCLLLLLVSIFSIIFRVYNNSHSSHVWLFAIQWTVACQALLSMGFSRQEYWSGLPILLWGIFPTQGWNPSLLRLLHWQAGSLPLSHLGSLSEYLITPKKKPQARFPHPLSPWQPVIYVPCICLFGTFLSVESHNILSFMSVFLHLACFQGSLIL